MTASAAPTPPVARACAGSRPAWRPSTATWTSTARPTVAPAYGRRSPALKCEPVAGAAGGASSAEPGPSYGRACINCCATALTASRITPGTLVEHHPDDRRMNTRQRDARTVRFRVSERLGQVARHARSRRAVSTDADVAPALCADASVRRPRDLALGPRPLRARVGGQARHPLLSGAAVLQPA